VHWPKTMLPENARVPIEGLSGQSFDMEVILNRGTSFVAGLMLQSWSGVQGSAAILYDWENSQLEVRTRNGCSFHMCTCACTGSLLCYILYLDCLESICLHVPHRHMSMFQGWSCVQG
jgi:hypothetical protein